jgi:hypothetical protein
VIRTDASSVTVKVEPFEVTIEEAASIVGLSRAQFYRDYLSAGRVKTVRKGKGRRRRMVVVEELRRAHEEYVTERRAGEK